jgi:hypothetical protein
LGTTKQFQIITSVSLSCLAKEWCIPIHDTFKFLNLPTQIYGQTAAIQKKVCGYIFTSIQCHIGSRDSSVSIATGYGLDDQGERESESR